MRLVSDEEVSENMTYFIENVGERTLYFTRKDTDKRSPVELVLVPDDENKVLCDRFGFVKMETLFPEWPQVLDVYNMEGVIGIFTRFAIPEVKIPVRPSTNDMFYDFVVYPQVFDLSLTLLTQMDPSKKDLIDNCRGCLTDTDEMYRLVQLAFEKNRKQQELDSLVYEFSTATHESLQGLLFASLLGTRTIGLYSVIKQAFTKVLSQSTTKNEKTVNNITAELFKKEHKVLDNDKDLLKKFLEKYTDLSQLINAAKSGNYDLLREAEANGDIKQQFMSPEPLLNMQQLWEELEPIYTTYQAGKSAAERNARQVQEALIRATMAAQKAKDDLAQLQRDQDRQKRLEAARADAEKRRQEELAEEARAQKEQEDAARAQKEEEDAARAQEAQKRMEELEKKVQELEEARKKAQNKGILMPVENLVKGYLKSDQKRVLCFTPPQIISYLQGGELDKVRFRNDTNNGWLSKTEAQDRMGKVVQAIKTSMQDLVEHFKATHENTANFFIQVITIALGNTDTHFENTLKNEALILGDLAQKFALVAKHYALWFELIFTIDDGVTTPSEEQREEIVKKMLEFLKKTYPSISQEDVILLYNTIVAIFFVEAGVTKDIDLIYQYMHVPVDHFLFAKYQPILPKPEPEVIIDLTTEDDTSGAAHDDPQGVSLPIRRVPPPSRPPSKP